MKCALEESTRIYIWVYNLYIRLHLTTGTSSASSMSKKVDPKKRTPDVKIGRKAQDPKRRTPDSKIKERPIKLPKGNKIPAGIKKVYGFK